MQWELLVALVVAMPVILFPVVFVWYLNLRGMKAAVRRLATRKTTPAETKAGERKLAVRT